MVEGCGDSILFLFHIFMYDAIKEFVGRMYFGHQNVKGLMKCINVRIPAILFGM